MRPSDVGERARHRARRRAHPAHRPAGRGQRLGLPAHAAELQRAGQRGCAPKARRQRRRSAPRPTASAPRSCSAGAPRDAQRVRGEGDAQAAEIYARTYSRNPEFYSFYRSLQAYRNSLGSDQDVHRALARRRVLPLPQPPDSPSADRRRALALCSGRICWRRCALYLVLEGIMPFLNPQAMRRALRGFARSSDSNCGSPASPACWPGALLFCIAVRA